MFTGLPPESTGADERWLWLDSPHLTMAEHFQEHGYNTFSLAANTLLSTDTNLTQGFHVPMNTFKGKLATPAKKATQAKLLPMDRSQELSPKWTPPAHGATNAEWARAAYKDAGPLIARTFLRWTKLRKRPETPFFAYLNLMEAHTPRIPSRASRDRVLADDPELVELGLRTDAAHINLHFYNFGKHSYSEREIEAIEGVYDATLADLDIALAELFKGLESEGLLDDTIIVLTSDHGENLGDHGLFNHRFTLAESLTHVPLVVWAPGQPGGRLRGPVTTMDLFPTLAAWAGLPVPEHLDGIHLLDAPRPAVTRMEPPLRREIETVQSVHPDVAVDPWMKSGHALVDPTLHKVVRWDARPVQGFDLASDPAEERPIEADPEVLGAVESWRASVPPYDPSKRGPGDDPVHVRASQEELRQGLEALGYTTDDEE
jgi:arylsulfatase A-like enzyme